MNTGTDSPAAPAASPTALGERVARGTAWVVALRLTLRLLGVISTVILARLLTPADYGLIALATTLSAAMQLLGAYSFDLYLVRHPAPTRQHYDTVWTLVIIRNLLIAGLLLVAAEPAGRFFNDPRLASVVEILALALVVRGFANIGIVDFQKRLTFDREFQLFASVKLGSFVVTVTLAYLWRSYWALLAGIVTAQLLTLALSYKLHSYRPRWSLQCWRDTFDFAKWLLGYNLFSFAYHRGTTFVVGHLLGSQSLGFYAMAHEIADLASTELLMPIRRVLLPAYTSLVDDSAKLQQAFVDGLSVILLLGLPVAAGIGLTAAPLVQLALGPQWLACIELIQLMSIFALAATCMANVNPLLLALGQARLTAKLMALGVLVLMPALFVGIHHWQLTGAAGAVALTQILMCVLSLVAARRLLQLSWSRLLRPIWRAVVATALMALAVSQTGTTLQTSAPGWQLLSQILAGAVSYGSAIWLMWSCCGRPAGPEAQVIALLRKAVAARRHRA